MLATRRYTDPNTWTSNEWAMLHPDFGCEVNPIPLGCLGSLDAAVMTRTKSPRTPKGVEREKDCPTTTATTNQGVGLIRMSSP